MAAILIIDDEKVLAESLGILFRDEGHQTAVAFTGEAGLRALETFDPDIVFLDLRLPDRNGMEVLPAIRRSAPQAQVVMMTAYGDTGTVVEAIKLGAFNYLNKPFELQEILLLVHKALEQQSLKEEVAFLRERQHASEMFEEMVGCCPAIREVFQRIRLLAEAGDSSVLITGESGTGKELVAGALHRLGKQPGAFIEVNCSAIPENLLESELFGYEKGAFTGAHGRKKGLLELAANGTIFLDEIGEMPQLLQAKLLRFLEKRSFRRLGGTTDIGVRARIIAATNRDLREAVRRGSFREDLFYRLNVVPIHLPPLRQRGEDILLLARHFLARFARELARPALRLAPEVIDYFLGYDWPGNIRELRNIVERLLILCPGQEEIPADFLPPEILAEVATGSADAAENLDERLLEIERELVLEALARAGERKGKAAELLGISRHSLKRRLQKFGLQVEHD